MRAHLEQELRENAEARRAKRERLSEARGAYRPELRPARGGSSASGSGASTRRSSAASSSLFGPVDPGRRRQSQSQSPPDGLSLPRSSPLSGAAEEELWSVQGLRKGERPRLGEAITLHGSCWRDDALSALLHARAHSWWRPPALLPQPTSIAAAAGTASLCCCCRGGRSDRRPPCRPPLVHGRGWPPPRLTAESFCHARRAPPGVQVQWPWPMWPGEGAALDRGMLWNPPAPAKPQIRLFVPQQGVARIMKSRPSPMPLAPANIFIPRPRPRSAPAASRQKRQGNPLLPPGALPPLNPLSPSQPRPPRSRNPLDRPQPPAPAPAPPPPGSEGPPPAARAQQPEPLSAHSLDEVTELAVEDLPSSPVLTAEEVRLSRSDRSDHEIGGSLRSALGRRSRSMVASVQPPVANKFGSPLRAPSEARRLQREKLAPWAAAQQEDPKNVLQWRAPRQDVDTLLLGARPAQCRAQAPTVCGFSDGSEVYISVTAGIGLPHASLGKVVRRVVNPLGRELCVVLADGVEVLLSPRHLSSAPPARNPFIGGRPGRAAFQ